MTGWEYDSQEIVQEIEVWPYKQIPNPESVLENDTLGILWDFEI